MKKKPVVWLVRDPINDVHKAAYGFSLTQKPVCHDKRRGWEAEAFICSDTFERLTPKSCHLKPGEGPIKINVKITRAK